MEKNSGSSCGTQSVGGFIGLSIYHCSDNQNHGDLAFPVAQLVGLHGLHLREIKVMD